MELEIDNRQNIRKIEDELIKILEKLVKASLDYEGWEEDYEVSLSFVDNEEIHGLNKAYRGKDCPTDVLSFPMVDDQGPVLEEKILGDIVISVEKAIEQAEEYGHSFEREMAFLTVHSMFHLMGYDHMDEEEAKEMRTKEEAVLQQLGIKRE
ncbi:rRNA maturation RNase YbeY [Clostridium formicaceticum]|uniref:Endoribonuclease YbeY n=1 Tax=Clostridium formicaceticum TaxID=1497 RepID=A0AAC9RPW0_9CLOT|nr:rRNA maturation RNase YbeY [Clostridium formicaceticum]AOY77554.1 rRNA maturation RNase YbeY [Clostridium formicaceticum]ARE88130.1 Endoribonuclease YbeY [Clostridium formicaceticum]